MSIDKRTTKNGHAWRVRYRDPSGKSRSKQFRRKIDAEEFEATQRQKVRSGAWRDPAMARTQFRDVATEWLAASAHLKPRTIQDYRLRLGKHVLPVLGDVPIGKIRQADIRKIVADMQAAGKGVGTVRNVARICSGVFEFAVADGLIERNPARGVPLPRPVRSEMLFLDAAQVEKLADTIDPIYRVMILTAAYCGLRAGELAALTVADLDLMRGSIDVKASYSELSTGMVLGDTKTYARRSVSMPRFLCDEFAAYLAAEGVAAEPAAHVFRSQDRSAGVRRPVRQTNFYRRVFKPAVYEAGLPDGLRFHDLRHTCAALMIAQGAHPRMIMDRLGHSSVTVSLDRYGHLLPSLDEALTEGLGAMRRTVVAGRG